MYKTLSEIRTLRMVMQVLIICMVGPPKYEGTPAEFKLNGPKMLQTSSGQRLPQDLL